MLGGRLQGGGAATVGARVDHESKRSSCWHSCPEHMEQCYPCRDDGISPAHEASLRKSYCVFMQKLGRQLKLPQVTIATAIIFCHRFFLRQSLATNDIYLIATVCMFLAGKVEETPERLQNVIVVSYEVRNAEDPDAALRIKQKEVYDEQKELLLMGERLVLVTLGFNLNVVHPYKALIAAIKRLTLPETNSMSQLAQISWNFVNDGLQTLLCLQFKPGHVAAGALYLAAKFLRIKLFCDWEDFLLKEFDISPQQLEDVSNHILQAYESPNNLGLNAVIRVATNDKKGTANEACTRTRKEAATVSPSIRCGGENQWPAIQSKVLEVNMEERETMKTHNMRIDIEDARCQAMHSDLTEEKEVPELVRSSQPEEEDYWEFKGRQSEEEDYWEFEGRPPKEEDYWEFEGRQCCWKFERNQRHVSPMEDVDARSIGKVWLRGRERKMGRAGRHASPLGLNGNGRDGTIVGIKRHDPWVRISSRERGVRKVTTRREPPLGLTGMKKDEKAKKVVTRRDFLLMLSNKKKAAKESMRKLHMPDFDSGHLHSHLKLSRRKVEIVRQHQGPRSRGSMEIGIKRSRHEFMS